MAGSPTAECRNANSPARWTRLTVTKVAAFSLERKAKAFSIREQTAKEGDLISDGELDG
jgi:hypothetical protein